MRSPGPVLPGRAPEDALTLRSGVGDVVSPCGSLMSRVFGERDQSSEPFVGGATTGDALQQRKVILRIAHSIEQREAAGSMRGLGPRLE